MNTNRCFSLIMFRIIMSNNHKCYFRQLSGSGTSDMDVLGCPDIKPAKNKGKTMPVIYLVVTLNLPIRFYHFEVSGTWVI